MNGLIVNIKTEKILPFTKTVYKVIMRIGLFGGTFNPVHNGHIKLAEEGKKQLNLDKVFFLPSYVPPHKNAENIALPFHRMKMLELAIDGMDGFEVSDYEISQHKVSYSINTIRYFKEISSAETDIFFLIGQDAFNGLRSWKEADELFELCSFAVCNRPGSVFENSDIDFSKISIDGVAISSTQIRNRIKEGKDIKGMVSPLVYSYIVANNLYK
ncbi:MAG: nicotinate-nucleotide adenylyltransferase [Candidatus Omnitrophota bacterium]